MSTDNGHELGWNDAIENDVSFNLLPSGEYPFEVIAFERGRHTPKPDGKLPACNKAIISLRIDGGDLGETTVKHNLFLHSSCEGLLCEFFRAIGARKHGERLVMDWNKVIGGKGRCKIGIRKGSNGNDYNEVKSLLDPADANKPGTGFKRGEF
jgi:hypothetical protein